MKGYFKFSYKKRTSGKGKGVNSETKEWWIVDENDNFIEEANLPETILQQLSTNNHELTQLPLITVITVVLNGAKYLEETIQSVINQTYPNVEYIIIDGGSTDGTLDIIKKYEDRIDYWISEKDRGIYDAMNKGVTTTTGVWIAFLGAGDKFLHNAILDYILFINNTLFEKPDIITSKAQLVSSTGWTTKVIGSQWRWKTFRKYFNIAHVGALHNMTFFKSIGLFSLKYAIASDYELLLRKKDRLKAAYLDKISVYMLDCGVSRNRPLVLWETLNIKILHRTRSKILAMIDYMVALTKFYLKRFLAIFYGNI